MYKIKLCFYILLAVPALIAFAFVDKDNRRKIMMDIHRFESVRRLPNARFSAWRLYRALVSAQEFRSIYYMRIGHMAKIIKYFLKPMPLCGVGGTLSAKVGGGVYIQHGWGMVLDAESVGENLWINQNVTVGYRGDGHPRIGNNVRIGTGAVVLGRITIGDNVNIGANAIVTKDVPSNTTVVSPQAFIIKRDGKRVYEEL